MEDFYGTLIRLMNRKVVVKVPGQVKTKYAILPNQLERNPLELLSQVDVNEKREHVEIKLVAIKTKGGDEYIRVLALVRIIAARSDECEQFVGTTLSGRAVKAPRAFVAEPSIHLTRELRLNERAERDAKELEETWQAKEMARIKREHARRLAEQKSQNPMQQRAENVSWGEVGGGQPASPR